MRPAKEGGDKGKAAAVDKAQGARIGTANFGRKRRFCKEFMRVIGIESSCDETAVAVYDQEQGLLSHRLYSQVAMHQAYGGVVPELASRDHVRRLLPLVREALAEAESESRSIDGVAYTAGPGLIGALLVGAGFARGLAYAWGKPAVPIHHLEGHLLAPLLEADAPAFPFLALLVSGGHTQLVDVSSIGRYRILGETLDDAAGEAFDKTAKMLGLPYPGGAALADPGGGGPQRPLRLSASDAGSAGPHLQFQWLEDRCPSSLAGPRFGRPKSGRRCTRFPGSRGGYARGEIPASPARNSDIGAWSSPGASARTGNCANGWPPSRSRAERSCIFRGQSSAPTTAR